MLVGELVDDPAEEPVHEQLLRGLAIEPARHGIEQLLVAERARGRAVPAARDVVRQDLEDRNGIGACLLGQEHVPALLIAAGPARRRLDPDLPVEDGLRRVVQRREIEEVALRAPPVEVLKAVHVDTLRVSRRHESVELHDPAAGLDVRLDPRLRAAAADEHVERREVAVARRPVPLRPEVPDVLGEATDADVADLRAVAGVDLEKRDRETLARSWLRREVFDER